MKRQGRRATVSTLLAAFYLPLSLVTSILGMNLKEFDDARPSVILCFEALFVVIAVTLSFYGLFCCLPRV
jgi:Mg2+ and Co2+ transporter CorA